MIVDSIKYKTFSELMASVTSDMDVYSDNMMIDDSKFIKIIRKVNADLSIKINREKEVMLDIVNHKAILPDDFMYLQLALLCSSKARTEISRGVDAPKISHDRACVDCPSCTVPEPCLNIEPCQIAVNPCIDPNSCVNDNTASICGTCYRVNERIGYDLTFIYDINLPVKLTKKSHKFCADSCMNLSLQSNKYEYTLDINENVLIVDNIKNGKLYLNYLTDMVNDEGELLVVDHPLVNDYYEYAVKTRMLENFLFNDKAPNIQSKLQLANERLKEARIEAMNFTFMPEYTDLLNYCNAKKSNFHRKYIQIFNHL